MRPFSSPLRVSVVDPHCLLTATLTDPLHTLTYQTTVTDNSLVVWPDNTTLTLSCAAKPQLTQTWTRSTCDRAILWAFDFTYCDHVTLQLHSQHAAYIQLPSMQVVLFDPLTDGPTFLDRAPMQNCTWTVFPLSTACVATTIIPSIPQACADPFRWLEWEQHSASLAFPALWVLTLGTFIHALSKHTWFHFKRTSIVAVAFIFSLQAFVVRSLSHSEYTLASLCAFLWPFLLMLAQAACNLFCRPPRHFRLWSADTLAGFHALTIFAVVHLSALAFSFFLAH